MTTALCLIALILGFRTLIVANTEKEGIKILGQAISIFVMIAAVILLLVSLCPKYGKGGGDCVKKCAKSGYSQPICPLSQKK